ncbi:MAG: SAM-dependent methyltransferase [Clostridiales bacterium]|nr:SAM-dependent methyltransferase [Clostridiales bacterium]
MARQDKNDKLIYRHLLKLEYQNTWEDYTNNKEIVAILSHASKADTGGAGIPDFIYVNEYAKLLIMIEAKPGISLHVAPTGKEDAKKYAVCGIKHYLSRFTASSLSSSTQAGYFSQWKIVGIAVSGNIEDDYNHRVSTFLIVNGVIEEQKSITDILCEIDYINLFENIDEEETIAIISASSKKINKWLRSVDSQKRPILLSALMICLFEGKGQRNDFKADFVNWAADTIISNIPSTVEKNLKTENVPIEKIALIKAELAFLPHDQDLNNSPILQDILMELRDFVIPLFKRKSNYDIIGKFYEEFLRYAGVANVKKGIVLTPRHITSLFTELIELKTNDVIFDPACGTGAFLIAAMNKLVDIVQGSSIPNKESKIKSIKERQLIGFEKNATMYSLAISNMLFRGDGKSNITYCDCFSEEAQIALDSLAKEGIAPTIGFVNPPYGGKDRHDNPTKKEIQFLAYMLDRVSRYGLIIAPLSTFFKEEGTRNAILSKHTLKCVVNMPKDLFMPNAATNTAIAVFETHRPHGGQSVVFYDLQDDGLVLSKAKGRTDAYNKWGKIKQCMLKKLAEPGKYEDGLTLVRATIKDNDEWLIQAHCNTDYSHLSEASFSNAVKEYMVFAAKQEMGLLEAKLDEISLLVLLAEYYSDENSPKAGDSDE